jgi:dipeptidyl aminopeptidase/acylaminoacyl peptidase
MTIERAYGSWQSPITTEMITSQGVRLGVTGVDGENIYWSESRPLEGGRHTVVKRSPSGELTELVPAPYNARTRVHEYGGASQILVNGMLYFTNFADQRVYRAVDGSDPEPITPGEDIRLGGFIHDSTRNRLIAVREDHTTGAAEPVNTIGAVDLDAAEPKPSSVIVEGYDFFSNPALSPDGSTLAWLAWDHPNMPWDGTELWVGHVDANGAVANPLKIAGGPAESIFQPQWSPDGDLYFVSDRTGWWNLYRHHPDGDVNLCPDEAEYGLPMWTLGMSTYSFAGPDRIVIASAREGKWSLGTIETSTGEYSPIRMPSTALQGILAGPGYAIAQAASPVEAAAIVRIDLETQRIEVLRRSSASDVDRGYVSVPGAITFSTSDGEVAHGFFYPPQNQDFTAPDGELPPLIVESHGGPTGSTDTGLDLKLQYWTSRGFAVLDVNYRGSTGYGRAYREQLKDKWGIAEVDDCVNGALHLAAEGLVDGERLIIQGWSASGYTTLAALAFRDEFKAGASHYGISELEAMVKDTHKFESRYLEGLIGPYPEAIDNYKQRSPIYYVDQLSCPLILFQGLEDKVVPPNQAQMMYDAVNEKDLPVALVMFEGEQHGFRKAENIRRALDGQLYFLSRVFGFEPADEIEPVPIANLA